MPSPIYAWFEGANQGAIEGWGSWPGEDDQEGRDGSSLIQQFDHEMTIPRDPQSGLASGRRVHHPVRIVKRLDKASPKLYKSLVTNNIIPTVTITHTVSGADGGEEPYLTYTLEEVVVSSYDLSGENTGADQRPKDVSPGYASEVDGKDPTDPKQQ